MMHIRENCRKQQSGRPKARNLLDRELCVSAKRKLFEYADAQEEGTPENSEFPDAKLLFSWARILESTGDMGSAVAAYQRAALIDPTDENIRAKLKQLARPN